MPALPSRSIFLQPPSKHWLRHRPPRYRLSALPLRQSLLVAITKNPFMKSLQKGMFLKTGDCRSNARRRKWIHGIPFIMSFGFHALGGRHSRRVG
jgi:hypothetical protein